jgi:hypothetical protein
MRQPRQVAFGSGASVASRIADEVDPHVEVVGLVGTRDITSVAVTFGAKVVLKNALLAGWAADRRKSAP